MFFFALPCAELRVCVSEGVCVCVWQVGSNLTAFVTKQINCCPLSINLQAPTHLNPIRPTHTPAEPTSSVHCVQPQVLRRGNFCCCSTAPLPHPRPACCNCYSAQPIQLISMAIHIWHLWLSAHKSLERCWPKKVGNIFCKQSQAPR